MSDTESESANTLNSDNQFSESNVSVTTSPPEDTDCIVTLQAQSPSEVWSEIATTTTFRLKLVNAVIDLISGDPPSQWNTTLYDNGVTALNGAYADVVRSLAYVSSNQSDAGRPLTVSEKINHAFTLTTQFGSPGNSVLGWSLRLDEIKHGPLALIDAASVTQSLGVRIGDQFKDQRADHRREICQLLTWLGKTVDLTIIASPQTQAWLRDHHHQHLPECVSEQCNIRVHGESRFEELIADAHTQLKPGSREVRILRELATDQSQTLSYSTLYESHDVSPSRMRQCFSTLTDLDLVRKIQRQNGYHLKLTTPGEKYLEQLSDQDSDANQPTGHSSDHSRVLTRDKKENPRAQPRTNETGKVAATRLDRHEYSAIVAGAPQQGIGLVDHPIDRKDDGREPSWYYDAATDRLVVSAEWHNPMQYLVAITHALSHSQIWTTVLPPSRLKETVSLDNLAISDTALLRDARCLGYLSDTTKTGEQTGEQFLAALGDARDELLAMTKNLHHGNYDDRNQHRAAILRNAHGLTGTIVHLLDLVGINLTREIRLPDFTRDYGPDRREDVLTNLAMMASIQSKYGAFAAFRQLYEPREKKRQMALTPAIDETDDSIGELIGGFTIVGDGVTELQSPLATDFQTPYTVHDDAPEIAIQIPVHNRTRMRSASETAIRQALSEQESSLQPLCKLLIHAYTGTPYDAARVAQYLSTVYQDLADLTPAELHTGIATLGRNRIFPDENPTISGVTHALLQTGQSLSQADAAEAADVKPRSLRRNKTRLSELGLLNQTNPEWVLSTPLQAATSIPSSQNQNDDTVNQIRNLTQHTQLMNLLKEKARVQTTNTVSQALLGDSD